MTGFSERSMESVQSLLAFCDHILEEEYSDAELLKMQKDMEKLKQQSTEYKDHLLDQEMHSKSGKSRKMASFLLAEEANLEEWIRNDFPEPEKDSVSAFASDDLNIGALYVEYLTGRAVQSVREALIGAMNLKLLSNDE